MTTLREAAQQEPVAWTTMPHTDDWLFVSGAMKPSLPGDWHPLYTHPRREWRGLTDEEREAAIRWAIDLENTQFSHTVARAIEAKLKEKNV